MGAEVKALELFHQLRSGANSMSLGERRWYCGVGQMTHEEVG